MKRFFGVMLAALFIMGICVPAFSQNNDTVSVTLTVVTGEIVTVDALAGTMVVKEEKNAANGTGENYNVIFSQDVKIMKADTALKVDELKVKDKVIVSGKTEEGKLKAEAIVVAIK